MSWRIFPYAVPSNTEFLDSFHLEQWWPQAVREKATRELPWDRQ